jgi:hypothetical protein
MSAIWLPIAPDHRVTLACRCAAAHARIGTGVGDGDGVGAGVSVGAGVGATDGTGESVGVVEDAAMGPVSVGEAAAVSAVDVGPVVAFETGAEVEQAAAEATTMASSRTDGTRRIGFLS